MNKHTRSDKCLHDECQFYRAHIGGGPYCQKCHARAHAVASDWGAYSFGHSGGHVFFVVACECGHVDRDPSGCWDDISVPSLEIT